MNDNKNINNKDEMKNKDINHHFELYNRAINELSPIKEVTTKNTLVKNTLEKGDNSRENKRQQQKSIKLFPMVSMFIAGALVVGTLSLLADYFNVFSNASSSYRVHEVSTANKNSMKSITQDNQDGGGENQSISSTYEKASQAVVKIEKYSEPSTTSMFNDPSMWMFYNRSEESLNSLERSEQDHEPQSEDDLSQLELTGSGTGYLFDADGYILTNDHVINGAKYVAVTVPGYDEPFKASVVSSSSELDIAVLKIQVLEDGKQFAFIPLGNSDDINVGEWVMAIGNPYGYDYTLTLGIISAKERPITVESSEGEAQTIEHMLQTDASINPGNSGGPLLNEAGDVIGMNTAINAEAQGMGFAIPINVIKEYLNTLTL